MISLVAGGGGFIGSHLVNKLVANGNEVVVADIKPLAEWCQINDKAYNIDGIDLSAEKNCEYVTKEIEHVYMLAADMGGMGFIENNKLACMLSVLTSTNMLLASTYNNVQRYFYSSSACVYAADKQTDVNVMALKEEDAYPAEAEDGYGWEKLFTERMCHHFDQETPLITRVARFHNVYGTFTTFDGGREKAPAALCRKVVEAQLSGNNSIDIWGDGNQTRSFMEIEDCINGIIKIMESSIEYPINLGSSELVSINDMVTIIEDIAGVKLERQYDLTAPQGVRGRNSDNTKILQELNWEPSIKLYNGLEKLYKWIYNQLA